MKKGDTVNWKWGKSEAQGKITGKHTEPVAKTIKGTKVKRNASKNEPAYDIKQDNGNKVLKSESELTPAHAHRKQKS
ncbi:DUF2945 domain-containing protein [Mucilaginibacter aquaedulcis]|uniref:DUF2945 domain-containing protein n=1 Tax=Mucilaginibacter aquaedulcis TaxID=1187081 RepID=UPI0025B3F184|nr:DUF2945 domain-containing protein [Mucilaginibacter aquaedulcis]MDN3549624.1 DUF2945 domain-containing protein [Mucilaginibacter aquaedulcis]